MMMKVVILIAAALTAFGGQSLQLNGRNAAAGGVPAMSKDAPIERSVYVPKVDLSVLRNLVASGAFGIRVATIGDGATITVDTSEWNVGETGSCQFPAPQVSGRGAFYLRVSRDPVAKTEVCRVWDTAGVLTYQGTKTYTSNSSSTNAEVFLGGYGAQAGDLDIAFFQINNVLSSSSAGPPTTVNPYACGSGLVHEWKLDGAVTASCGGVTLTVGGGSASYSSTPFQNNFALPQALPTSWSNWTSMRAGAANPITGSGSYSQADASRSVTCRWNQTDGPSVLIFANPSSCDTTVTGAIFGTYTLRLVVQGASGSPGEATITVGAVATDSNGVVVNANPAADFLFGPMMAFGKNPWEFVDDTALRAVGPTVRGAAALQAAYPIDWRNFNAGTVTYIGSWIAGPQKTTLAAGISATDTTITVTSAAALDFTSLPTAISMGYNGEAIRICSVSSNTLTVCPDGRGWSNTTATSYSTGATVYQPTAAGSGTSFLANYCGGKIGPPVGTGLYTTGTISTTAGSATLTGSGTGWVDRVNAVEGYVIRIDGTISGQPFVFIAKINSVNSATSITMSRAWPAAATNLSGASYEIYNPNRTLAPEWIRPDATTGQTLLDIIGCVSDTRLIYGGGLEVLGTTPQTAKRHASTTQAWATSGGNGTPNFYDEVLANYAMYLRSGSPDALAAARYIGDAWATSPWIDEGWGVQVSTPRNVSAAGIVASWQLDGRNWLNTIKRLAQDAETNIAAQGTDCTRGDLREDAYRYMWLAFAAKYDTAQTARWQTALASVLARDQACQDANGAYWNWIYFNTTGPQIGLTNGSTAITGTGFTNNSTCQSDWNGTVTVTNGSATVTGSSIPAFNVGDSIALTGTKSGQPYIWSGPFIGSGSSITLASPWQGDSGSIVAVKHYKVAPYSEAQIRVIGDSNSDATLTQPYDCYYNSSTSLTLTAPWRGSNATKRLYNGNLAGRGVQSFMAGIKSAQYKYASQADATGRVAQWNTLGSSIAGWIRNSAYDPYTKGLTYGWGFPWCVEVTPPTGYSTPPPSATVQDVWTQSQCQHGYSLGAVGASRALSAEAQNAARLFYEASPTLANRQWGDEFYGAQWGVPSLTQAGLPTNDGIANDYATSAALDDGKWYGFQFGIGMAHQWPAVRVGGLAPESLVTRTLFYSAPTGTTVVVARVVWPSGAPQDYLCSAGSCSVQYDSRQGTGVMYQMLYYKSGNLISTGQLLPLDFN